MTGSGPGDKNEFGGDTSLDVGNARCLALGPGSKLLAVGNDEGVQLWDVPTKTKTQTLSGREYPTVKLVISADGHTLAGLGADQTSVLAWDLTSNKPRCRIGDNRGSVGGSPCRRTASFWRRR